MSRSLRLLSRSIIFDNRFIMPFQHKLGKVTLKSSLGETLTITVTSGETYKRENDIQ